MGANASRKFIFKEYLKPQFTKFNLYFFQKEELKSDTIKINLKKYLPRLRKIHKLIISWCSLPGISTTVYLMSN